MIGIVNDAELMVPLKSRFEVILSFASYRIIILDSDLSENRTEKSTINSNEWPEKALI